MSTEVDLQSLHVLHASYKTEITHKRLMLVRSQMYLAAALDQFLDKWIFLI